MVLPSPKAPIARAIGEGSDREQRRTARSGTRPTHAPLADRREHPSDGSRRRNRGGQEPEQDPPRQCEIAWNDLITHERHHSQPWASHSPGKEGDDKPRNRQERRLQHAQRPHRAGSGAQSAQDGEASVPRLAGRCGTDGQDQDRRYAQSRGQTAERRPDRHRLRLAEAR